MRLPLELAASVTQAKLVDRKAAPSTLRVCTDTRSLEPGDTFLALRGEHFDGHDFVTEAVQRGAAMLVIDDERRRPAGAAAMIVNDAKAAYLRLAGAARALFEGSVIAITGSAGKTTTKDFLAQLLAERYTGRVLAAARNENNEIGVSKLLLALSNREHDVAVVEMGARHYGDIAALVEIARPQFGILTNVGEAHLEIMGSRTRLEETKWALFAHGARAILNAADAVSRRRAPSLDAVPHWFAADLSSVETRADLEVLTAFAGPNRLVHRRGARALEFDVAVSVPGAHNRANLAAATAGALELGVAPERLIDAIARVRLPEGRYDRISIGGGIALIYDAYNANASSMIAALDAFAAEAAARRIAVLASMAELGVESKTLHERVGEHAAAFVDVLLLRGEYATDVARGAQRAGLDADRIVRVETNAQAVAWLRAHARADDLVLLKGSRKYKLEEIVEELRS
ncbi:MAG TPA: UDP-N-acetylmuramoyl-tripeptide--D-alanyl-D-alanine ligase [Candidatus Cybelea sp.]|nr:UDP-N-acetylmuramoyl-tripeptide--D-alanyl-D-alanine ligase [Candidatus Cybelea sp.]